jgi:hypothetical protein
MAMEIYLQMVIAKILSMWMRDKDDKDNQDKDNHDMVNHDKDDERSSNDNHDTETPSIPVWPLKVCKGKAMDKDAFPASEFYLFIFVIFWLLTLILFLVKFVIPFCNQVGVMTHHTPSVKLTTTLDAMKTMICWIIGLYAVPEEKRMGLNNVMSLKRMMLALQRASAEIVARKGHYIKDCWAKGAGKKTMHQHGSAEIQQNNPM